MISPAEAVRRELCRWRKDRSSHLLLFWLPLLACILLLAIFSRRTIVGLPIAVVDLDQSAVSRQITAQIDAAPAVRVQRYDLSMAGARRAMERGEVYAVVEFPDGFRRDILRGGQPNIGLLLNQQSLAAAGAVSRDIQAVVLTAAAVESATLRAAAGTPLPEAAALAQPIRVQTHPLFNPGLDYAAYLGIALIAASLHCFVILHGARCIASEGKNWPHTSGWAGLGGKFITALLWWWGIGAGLLFASYWWLDLPPVSEPVWLLAGWALLAIAYLTLGATFALVLPSHVAYSCVSVIAGPAVAFSGVTFPQGAMPLLPRLFGESLPLTWFLHLQTELVTELLDVRFAAPELLRLVLQAGFFALAAALAFYWRRRRFREGIS